VVWLRRALGPEVGARIITGDGGYRPRISDGELDLAEFTAAVRRGRQAGYAGQWHECAAQQRAALGLWRGPLLSGVYAPSLIAEHAPSLDELRLQALQSQFRADLQLGRHNDVTSELVALVKPTRTTRASPSC
jgi:hypothetical protein